MGKSNWRLNFISKSILLHIGKQIINLNKKKTLIFSKSSVVPHYYYNKSVLIYKGLKFRYLKLSKYHVGYKFGEFVLTRKPNIFIKKIKK